ncbi:Zinc finger matrin-type protein 5 [Mactra antiquata]
MGKRFYCDFCDRSFADTGVNRKNHFKGVQHQRMRKQHYDSFRDAATILNEESMKIPCKRFLQDPASCDYGDSCKFSHLTPERRHQLEQQVLKDKLDKDKSKQTEMTEPSLEEWLEKRRQKRLKIEPNNDSPIMNYELPPFLVNVPNLPPSLLPPTIEELKNKPTCEWG